MLRIMFEVLCYMIAWAVISLTIIAVLATALSVVYDVVMALLRGVL